MLKVLEKSRGLDFLKQAYNSSKKGRDGGQFAWTSLRISQKGVNYALRLLWGMVAQSVEHCTFNAVVTGSNPVHPTNFR